MAAVGRGQRWGTYYIGHRLRRLAWVYINATGRTFAALGFSIPTISLFDIASRKGRSILAPPTFLWIRVGFYLLGYPYSGDFLAERYLYRSPRRLMYSGSLISPHGSDGRYSGQSRR